MNTIEFHFRISYENIRVEHDTFTFFKHDIPDVGQKFRKSTISSLKVPLRFYLISKTNCP